MQKKAKVIELLYF